MYMAKNKDSKFSLSVHSLGVFILVLATVVAVGLFYSTVYVSQSYKKMQDSTEVYIQTQINAAQLKASSDYLTEESRLYVITGEREHLDNYFEEVYVTKSREEAIENMMPYMNDSTSYPHLRIALNYSNRLVEFERHAFALSLLSRGIEREEWPQELQNENIIISEMELSPEEKQAMAESILFEGKYIDYKFGLNTNIQLCTDEVKNSTNLEQNSAVIEFNNSLTQQRYLILSSLFIIIGVVVIVTIFIISPIMNSVKIMKNHGLLPEKGLKEIQAVSKTYNNLLNRVEQNTQSLEYEANHDSLTTLLNRKAYNENIESIINDKFCLLILDIDNFKRVNDTYGHDVGDAVLVELADALYASFRSDDKVYRLGGDEIAVILEHIDESGKDIIKKRISSVAEKLKMGEDGMPSVTISAGAAFSSDGVTVDEMYKKADLALYEAKKEKNRLVFYDGEL